MSKKRRKFSNQLKFTIVLEALKGHRQIAEIASEYNVHPNQISNWKKQFMDKGAGVFGEKTDNENRELKDTQEELFRKIGHQQYEIEWLKKLKPMGTGEKKQMVECNPQLSLTQQCKLLGLPRSSLYYNGSSRTKAKDIPV